MHKLHSDQVVISYNENLGESDPQPLAEDNSTKGVIHKLLVEYPRLRSGFI